MKRCEKSMCLDCYCCCNFFFLVWMTTMMTGLVRFLGLFYVARLERRIASACSLVVGVSQPQHFSLSLVEIIVMIISCVGEREDEEECKLVAVTFVPQEDTQDRAIIHMHRLLCAQKVEPAFTVTHSKKKYIHAYIKLYPRTHLLQYEVPYHIIIMCTLTHKSKDSNTASTKKSCFCVFVHKMLSIFTTTIVNAEVSSVTVSERERESKEKKRDKNVYKKSTYLFLLM